MIFDKKGRNNLISGIMAQALTFLVNVGVSFFLPRVLGIEQFAYWQLFIFYVGYVCFFHFGLPDGIYLVNGGKNIDELNKEMIAAQFRYMCLFHVIIATVISTSAIFLCDEIMRKETVIFAAVYLIIINFNNYYGMIYQAVNEAKWYSVSLMIDKAFFLFCFIILWINKVNRFEAYVFAYCLGRILSCIYSTLKCKGLLFARKTRKQNVWGEIFGNIKIGSNLMLSIISSSLIIGIGRVFIDGKWGIKTFGIFSFALTLSNFILQFINQISIVLFPALRRSSKEDLEGIYIKMRRYIAGFLGVIPLAYFPISYLVTVWLPQYKDSIQFFAVLLPIAFFDGKMQLLGTTYFKVLRKEKVMLRVNIGTLLYSALFSYIGAYKAESIWVVVIGMISAIVIRDLISEYIIEKELNVNARIEKWLELLLICFYWCFTIWVSEEIAFIMYLALYIAKTMMGIMMTKKRR